MKTSIFAKAEKLKDKVIYIGSGRNLSFFTFDIDDPPKVSFKSSEKGTMLNSCSCHHHSIQPAHSGVLCSYVIAIIKAIPLKDGKIAGVEIEQP